MVGLRLFLCLSEGILILPKNWIRIIFQGELAEVAAGYFKESFCLYLHRRNFVAICNAGIDDSAPPWNVRLQNCVRLSGDESNYQKLPPRPERLNAYSRSLEKLGVTPDNFDGDDKFW